MTNQSKTERVVVGVDGSAASESALSWAAHYAMAVGGTIRAVLAWHYPAAVGRAPVGVAPPGVTAGVEQSRHEILDKAIEAALVDPASMAIERKIAYGHPAQVLIDESNDADLLVVGHRGHGGFTDMLVGSVSTHCVTHSHCPVTVVRSV